ncbi:LysR family transcriptional regulator [Celeribacter halophilus]|uniref:LysR family transcriptional regulator n=1 Tax=Celeribacter halophilus TaxID=576117 RepID=UPI001C09F6B2|nr:LysR family transcriptional regulator [Celeribacter halophilus]MBU2889530.1 LysR family transcriptional regulator [Celeribacter halophilus]MDO6512356.1 LysR family transcriptional regulator [Celeribacter halophilus]
MEIRTLKTFVTVANLKGFTAAARALNTVQPAVSRQISELEQELGVSLFWRSTREVRITAAGEALLREATEILAHEERTRHLVRQTGEGRLGRLRIGFISSAVQPFLPGLVREFSTCFPQVQVSLYEMTAAEQHKALEAGQIDIALSRALPLTASDYFESVELYTDHLVAFLPEGHALASEPEIELFAMSPHPFVLFQREGAPDLFDQVVSACLRAGFSPQTVVQPNSMQAVLTAVGSGLGVTLAPACIRHLNTVGCVSRAVIDVSETIPLQLHFRGDRIEAATRAFVTLLRNRSKDIRKDMELRDCPGGGLAHRARCDQYTE